MGDILDTIVAWKRVEIERQKEELPPRKLYALAEQTMEEERPSMRESLAGSPYGIIAEFKRKSPSKGWIHPDAEPLDIIPKYIGNGASALSILTDEKFFGGSPDFIQIIHSHLSTLNARTPILRKDFIVDEYQLFQARWIGASAVLLIAADLTLQECKSLAHKAHELGLEVLLEIHSEQELDYTEVEVDMVGVNNRNLGTFHTDVANSFRMATLLPPGHLWVSESGISHPGTIRELREAGYRGFLIGETFMKEADPGEALKKFISELQ